MFSWDKIKIYANPLIKMFLIIVIGHIIARILIRIFRKAFERSKIEQSLAKFFLKTINIVFHVLIFMSALSSIGVSSSGVLAALSAAAVGVAVALKDSLSNVAGGILLLVSPRFVTGDYIEVQGDSGTVISVDLLHTTIRTPDNKQISIPNGLLLNNHITNYTSEPLRRLDITVPVSYEADIDKAKTIIEKVILANELVLSEPEKPVVRVIGYGESSVNIVARIWCNKDDYWSIHFYLMENIMTSLKKDGIEIPFNQLDVHIKNN